jgi:chitodextrinase
MTAGKTYSYSVVAYDEAGNNSLTSQPLSIDVPKPVDTQSPTIPTNVTAVTVGVSQINVSWRASNDNTAVATYDVYRSVIGGNAVRVATLAGTEYGDTGLTENTNYNYYIIARDANGNASAQSTEVTAKTQAITPTTPTVPSDPTQHARVGTVRGSVVGKRGRPLSNTQIILASDEKRYVAVTNSDGIYRIDNVATGRYDVYYRSDGYQKLSDRVRVRESKSTINNVRLYENGRHVRWWNRWW